MWRGKRLKESNKYLMRKPRGAPGGGAGKGDQETGPRKGT